MIFLIKGRYFYMSVGSKNVKSKFIAIFLCICFGPFSIGDLYLGYVNDFKKQMFRYFILFVLFILYYFLDSKSSWLSLILMLLFAFCSFIIFCTYIKNIIKGFKILFGIVSTDADGITLK